MNLFPLVSWDFIDNDEADRLLVAWGHWLGGCNRPFGRQSFGLHVNGIGIIAVAVSASTVNAKCVGYARGECVELARLCAHPDYRWATRVALRLWRETAGQAWSAAYWPVRALVSYQNAIRHSGNLYRFDGWKRTQEVRGGVAGGGWSRGKEYAPKVVWTWEVA